MILNDLSRYRPGANFVSKVVVGILQYAVVTPLLFLMTALLRGSLQDPDLARFHRGLLRLKAVPPMIKGISCLCAMSSWLHSKLIPYYVY